MRIGPPRSIEVSVSLHFGSTTGGERTATLEITDSRNNLQVLTVELTAQDVLNMLSGARVGQRSEAQIACERGYRALGHPLHVFSLHLGYLTDEGLAAASAHAAAIAHGPATMLDCVAHTRIDERRGGVSATMWLYTHDMTEERRNAINADYARLWAPFVEKYKR